MCLLDAIHMHAIGRVSIKMISHCRDEALQQVFFAYYDVIREFETTARYPDAAFSLAAGSRVADNLTNHFL